MTRGLSFVDEQYIGSFNYISPPTAICCRHTFLDKLIVHVTKSFINKQTTINGNFNNMTIESEQFNRVVGCRLMQIMVG